MKCKFAIFNETTVVLVVLRVAREATFLGIFSLQKCGLRFLSIFVFKVEKRWKVVFSR